MTKPRKVPNASIADDNDSGTIGIDQGDRANNDKEGSDRTDVSDASDDVCLTVSSNTSTSPCNCQPSGKELPRYDVKIEEDGRCLLTIYRCWGVRTSVDREYSPSAKSRRSQSRPSSQDIKAEIKSIENQMAENDKRLVTRRGNCQGTRLQLMSSSGLETDPGRGLPG